MTIGGLKLMQKLRKLRKKNSKSGRELKKHSLQCSPVYTAVTTVTSEISSSLN